MWNIIRDLAATKQKVEQVGCLIIALHGHEQTKFVSVRVRVALEDDPERRFTRFHVLVILTMNYICAGEHACLFRKSRTNTVTLSAVQR